MEFAKPRHRLMAAMIDLISLSPLLLLHFYNLLTLQYPLLLFFSFSMMWCLKVGQEWLFGYTLGKRIVSLKIQSTTPPLKISFGQYCKRNALFTLWTLFSLLQGMLFLTKSNPSQPENKTLYLSLSHLIGFVPGLGSLDLRDFTTFLLAVLVILHFLNYFVATLTPQKQNLTEWWGKVTLVRIIRNR